jgi:ABC-type branched-subunit amino acid transport system ATPase component
MECANVGCAFGSNVVLRSVSLKVNPGTIHGLIGPNGAGKTTLFNAITGNAPLTNGEVRVKRTSVTPRPSIMSRLGLSRTFQNARVFLDRTGRDNVALAAEMSGHDVDPAYLNWVLSACDLRPIENVVVSKLSRFERRLVTIAMAIAPRRRWFFSTNRWPASTIRKRTLCRSSSTICMRASAVLSY